MQTVNFEEELEKIVAKDKRYAREAYLFVREALDHTQKMIGRPARNEIRHVTGGQLLEGVRDYALSQYGPMALAVLQEWGIRACEDVGELVFNMVENNLLAKTDQDSRADFKDVYQFEDAFRKPFQPSQRAVSAAHKPKAV
jgi:uncharacterized repeat protein (TIGR04138 family)